MKTLAQIKAEKQSKESLAIKNAPEKLRVKYKEKRNVFEDTQAEIAVLKEAFKNPLQKEREQKEKLTDGNFWYIHRWRAISKTYWGRNGFYPKLNKARVEKI